MPELMHICETCRYWPQPKDWPLAAVFASAKFFPCQNPKSEKAGQLVTETDTCPSWEQHPEAA